MSKIICVGASAGGHMNQLLKLLDTEQGQTINPDFYITSLEVLKNKLSKRGETFVIGECNRLSPFPVLKVFARSWKIVKQIKPDIVITTGAMPMAIFSRISKLFGAKIIWIDSIANINKFSLSGRWVRNFCDYFITQWEELAKDKQDVHFFGGIL